MPMFERFTDRARQVMQFANEEAVRFNHEFVGTEHMLLGVVKEGSGVAANVLKNLGLDLTNVRVEVEKLMHSDIDRVVIGNRPQTPRAKKAIEFAIEEARNFNHNYVGTEHLLLGILRECDGNAAQVLRAMGLELETIRAKVLEVVTTPHEAASTVDVPDADPQYKLGSFDVPETEKIDLPSPFADYDRYRQLAEEALVLKSSRDVAAAQTYAILALAAATVISRSPDNVLKITTGE